MSEYFLKMTDQELKDEIQSAEQHLEELDIQPDEPRECQDPGNMSGYLEEIIEDASKELDRRSKISAHQRMQEMEFIEEYEKTHYDHETGLQVIGDVINIYHVFNSIGTLTIEEDTEVDFRLEEAGQ